MYLSMIANNLMSLNSGEKFCSSLFDFSTNACSSGGVVFMKRHLHDEWYRGIKSVM